MQLSLAALSALLLAASAAAKTKPTELQVGVKFKPAACELQSAKGDRLSMCVATPLTRAQC
jgi:hypothetical protein